jgi:hypothetical protein
MRYCHDHAIPHSRFLEEWSGEDRDKLVAYLVNEGDRCSQCGTKESEWEQNRFAYVAETHLCMGCYITDAENENNRDSEGKSMPGTTVKLVLNTPEKQAEMLEFAARMRSLQRQE